MIVKERLSRKVQIENEATRMFRNKGYVGSSMRDLASALGIEAASLYSHVRSKEEILQNICFRIANNFLNGLQEVLQQGKLPLEIMHDAIVMHCLVMTRDISASAVFWNEWKHLSGKKRDEFLHMKSEYENAFIRIIENGITAGEFRQLDSKFAAMTILSSLNCIHVWYKPEGALTPEEVAEQLSQILLTGIRKLTIN